MSQRLDSVHRPQSIFLTGGTGMVGAQILKLLLARGYRDIRALRRASSRMDLVSDVADQVTWIEGSLMNTAALEEGMHQADWVIHAAALIAHGRSRSPDLYRVNIDGTANVVNAALAANVAKLLHVSSIAVFTRTGGTQHIDETTEWQRTPYTTEYGYSKYRAEMEVWRGNAEGLSTAIINPSIVLGAGFWENGSSSMFRRIWEGLRVYPVGVNGYVDVRDVACMAVLRLEHELGPERMILNAANLTFEDLFARTSRLLDRRPPTIRLPPWATEIAWRVMRPVGWLSGKSPAITRETARTTRCLLYFDNSRSLQVPGFTYTGIDQTLTDIASIVCRTAPGRYQPQTLPFLPHHLDHSSVSGG
ncbi:MAG: NAD-dependent epimerase/dehydratase family protein [Saprospiraceae bacterium]|nr:NAD-dependent epimerase/dehydratase family protein [Saprospiraceae bacterium]